ncbi:hypothetical protein BGX24_003826 [Mortierella sp. AD032]|nr:hypothetical protein BGX24_003826 [Mortierella sp. AD032]
MAYGIADENFLYIQGGLTTVDTVRSAINQFVALDLTVDSWSTSNPPWVWLQNLGTTAPPASSWHSMTVDRDRANLFMWDPYQQSVWWTYNIGQKQWYSYSNTLQTTKKAGVRNGVDMNTGYVYIPNGNNNGQEMIMNPPFTTSFTISAMPTHLMPEPVSHESFVWSTVRNSFLHYGGKSMVGTTGNPHLNEFSAAGGWAAVATTGSSPGDVSGHCMVPAYAGTKMIVFGGAGLDGVAKAGVYILDVRTRQWTEGKAADLDQARTNMACAVSGDSFISWGGESNFVNKDATPIVYDMKNNQWTIQFNRVIRAGVTIEPIDPSKSDPSPGSKSGSTNMDAIGGGVACAVVATQATKDDNDESCGGGKQ